MKKIYSNNRKGLLFWITGLSGSGKSTLGDSIFKYVSKKYGPTIVLSGDDLREIFFFKKFDKKSRFKYALSYSKICKKFVDQNVNIIFSTVSLFHKVRKWNRKNITNYLEIYIESDIDKLISKKKKFFYKKKHKNIVGKNIKAEFPKNPDIKIENKFNKSISKIKYELLLKIKKTMRN